jgi:hypothetical protein
VISKVHSDRLSKVPRAPPLAQGVPHLSEDVQHIYCISGLLWHRHLGSGLEDEAIAHVPLTHGLNLGLEQLHVGDLRFEGRRRRSH